MQTLPCSVVAGGEREVPEKPPAAAVEQRTLPGERQHLDPERETASEHSAVSQVLPLRRVMFVCSFHCGRNVHHEVWTLRPSGVRYGVTGTTSTAYSPRVAGAVPPGPQAPTSNRHFVLCFRVYLSGAVHRLSLCDWLISLSSAPSRFSLVR